MEEKASMKTKTEAGAMTKAEASLSRELSAAYKEAAEFHLAKKDTVILSIAIFLLCLVTLSNVLRLNALEEEFQSSRSALETRLNAIEGACYHLSP